MGSSWARDHVATAFLHAVLGLWIVSGAAAAAWPRPSVRACRGTTPVLDGHLDLAEWADASTLLDAQSGGTPWASWTPEFAPVQSATDLHLDAALVKFDGSRLYLGFNVTDDTPYDTPASGGAWLPAGNPQANNITREGWPWFGDEMELLLNAQPRLTPPAARKLSVVGNASQWQMVANVGKSQLGGMGKGGLLAGEPRSSAEAWATYVGWIDSGAMRVATRRHPGADPRTYTYTVEWSVSFASCVVIAPGRPFDPQSQQPGAENDVPLGFNVALGDTDRRAQGDARYGLRHEMWISGSPQGRTTVGEFGELILVAPGGTCVRG